MGKMLLGGAALMTLIGGGMLLFPAVYEARVRAEQAAANLAEEKKAAPVVDPVNPPRAVVPVSEYEFGVMQVGATGRHAFVIRNEGRSNLELKLEGTSCKCTLAELTDGAIPPGEEREVALEWTADERKEMFRHGAILRTNDPAMPEIRLTVVGSVLFHLLVEPPDTVIIGNIQPGERASTTVWLYSQVYEQLEVSRVETADSHFSWEVLPASGEDLQRWQAASGVRLKITTEPEGQQGRAIARLKVHLRVPGLPDDQQPEPQTVEVLSQIVNPVRLFGPLYQPTKVVEMGPIVEGTGMSTTMFLTIAGPNKDVPWEVEETICQPDFLQVKITRLEDASAAARLTRYAIAITVPADAPRVDFLQKAGEIVLRSQHPDVKGLKIPVAFAVIPAARGATE